MKGGVPLAAANEGRQRRGPDARGLSAQSVSPVARPSQSDRPACGQARGESASRCGSRSASGRLALGDSCAVIPEGRQLPAHVHEVREALLRVEDQISELWSGNGIDGRRVGAVLRDELSSWESERAGSFQELSWEGAPVRPFRVDGLRDAGRSIIEIEGGGALENNRLHRDLLNTMLKRSARLRRTVRYHTHPRSALPRPGGKQSLAGCAFKGRPAEAGAEDDLHRGRLNAPPPQAVPRCTGVGSRERWAG
jgi:hypothetical protein